MNFFQRLLRFLVGKRPRVEIPPDPLPSTIAVSPPTLPDPTADPYFAPATALRRPEKAPVKGTTRYDVGAFVPISRQEIKDAAKGTNLFGNAWFGRRDLIPAADDPRTSLIDRAMVTHGLLSPEQLREIHDVGALRDEIKPTFAAVEHKAALEGDAAVQADRDARAQIKARKKAEAADRKQRRIDDIAHRKATDIFFLGRGVSAGLGDRQSDLAALASFDLPALSTPADIAAVLGLAIPRLRWLAFHTDVASRVHYVHFTVPKKSGGVRTLSAPHRSLGEAQRWIFEAIVAKLPVEVQAHGFVPGRSILSNAVPHCRRAVVINLDLEGFFPSIGYPRVRRVFQRFGYSPAVATILALLCTECPRRTVSYDGLTYHVAIGPRSLPQGACTSPGLSNQVARRLDRRLGGLARRLDLTYTRYADDLTFSGDQTLNEQVGYVIAGIRRISRDEGFLINESKTRILRQNAAQTVTGLVVNDRPGVRRNEIRQLRAILHRAKSEGIAGQNRDGHPNYAAQVRGRIAYVGMSRPQVGARLQGELDALVNDQHGLY